MMKPDYAAGIVSAIEEQTEGMIRRSDLAPSSCDHPRCGFHGDFMIMPDKIGCPCSLSWPPNLPAAAARRQGLWKISVRQRKRCGTVKRFETGILWRGDGSGTLTWKRRPPNPAKQPEAPVAARRPAGIPAPTTPWILTPSSQGSRRTDSP
jgi:hypothetical protein